MTDLVEIEQTNQVKTEQTNQVKTEQSKQPTFLDRINDWLKKAESRAISITHSLLILAIALGLAGKEIVEVGNYFLQKHETRPISQVKPSGEVLDDFKCPSPPMKKIDVRHDAK